MTENDENIKEKKKFNLLSRINKFRVFKNEKYKDKGIEKNKKEFEKNFFKKINIYILATIIILILLAMFSIIVYVDNLKYKPYLKYEEKMKIYGFDKMYNNKSANTNESVTKSEAIKFALASVFNTDDISGFAAEHNEYENAIWTEYAQDLGIIKEDINSDNFNNKVKYKEVISYFESCKMKFLTDQSVKDVTVNFKDISKYTIEEQTAIKDMLAYEIINIVSSTINGNENIFKGQLNELVVNFVEKYNTITMPGDKININPEKNPANASQYPYVLANVDKEVYETPFESGYSLEALSPKDIYANKKGYYTQVKRYTEEFFNNILNVDYKTITEENLKQKLEPYILFEPNESAIKVYVKYVKDNEIIIEGNSKLQVPIIYFDGLSYRARMKLTFEIKHSNTKENLLYLDFFDGLKKTYEKTDYDILVDYYLSNAVGNSNLYLDETEWYNAILNKSKCGITKEVDKETYFKQEEEY